MLINPCTLSIYRSTTYLTKLLRPVQTDATLLDVTCCVRLHAHPVACCCVLLGVVAQSLTPVKLLATIKRTQQLSTLLRPFARSLTLRKIWSSFFNQHNHKKTKYMNWQNYRNQILQVSSQFEPFQNTHSTTFFKRYSILFTERFLARLLFFFNENTDQGNNEDKFVVITIGLVQFNIACISKHTGVKVRLQKQWLASEIYTHFFDTTMFSLVARRLYLVHEKTRLSFLSQQRSWTIVLVDLRPSLKSTLTRGLFIFPHPWGSPLLRPLYNTLVYRRFYSRVKPMTRA